MEHQPPYNPKPLWTNRQSAKVPPPPDASPYYEVERQPSAMIGLLNFCLKDGQELALPISDLEAVRLKSAAELWLYFGASLVVIRGHLLKPLYTQLLRKRVKTIREYLPDPNEVIAEGALQIESIVIESRFLEG